MTRGKKWLAGVAAVAVAVIVIHQMAFPTYSYRYRLQIAVSIDGKIHSGSSVIEVNWGCVPFKIADSGRCGSYLRGQAALVDLGSSHGVLVAVLRTGEQYTPAAKAGTDATFLAAKAFGNGSTDNELPALSHLTGRRDLVPPIFPYLVWFPNPADPKSARQIIPDNISTIDPTARFTEAFVEITRDSPAIDIAKKLPWLPDLLREQKGKLISGIPNQFHLVYNMLVGDD
jgi:hypothetical protein